MQKLRALLPPPINILWSLVFAVLVWFIADGRVRQTQDNVPVRLVIEVPAGYAYKFTDTGTRDGPPVTVSVYGPRQSFDRLPDIVRAVYRWDPARSKEGEEVAVPLSDFRLDLGSPELSEDEATFSPRAVEIVISKVARRELRVDCQIDAATIPAAWQVPADLIRVEPSLAEATGPERDFESPLSLTTEPIDVGRRLLALGWRAQATRPYTVVADRVRVRAPKGAAIEPVEPYVRVTLTVQPEPLEVELKDVKPAIVVEPFLDLKRFRVQPEEGLNLVSLKLRGPKSLLADERALRDQVRVYAVLTEKSTEQSPIALGKLRTLEVAVYPPAGVEWVNRGDVFRYQARVEEVAAAGSGG